MGRIVYVRALFKKLFFWKKKPKEQHIQSPYDLEYIIRSGQDRIKDAVKNKNINT
jgi:hypothetical protein